MSVQLPPMSAARLRKLGVLRQWLGLRGYGTIAAAVSAAVAEGEMLDGTDIDKRELFTTLLSEARELSAEQEALLVARLGTGRLGFYRGNNRSEVDYAFDLVAGWIVEDILALERNKRGQKIAHRGDDKARDFLQAPTADPDFELEGRAVDLFADFTGTWTRQKYFDFKPGKWNRLMKGTEEVLCVDLSSDLGILISSARQAIELCGGTAPEPSFNPRFGKETYRIPTPPTSGWLGFESAYGLGG